MKIIKIQDRINDVTTCEVCRNKNSNIKSFFLDTFIDMSKIVLHLNMQSDYINACSVECVEFALLKVV